MRVMLRTGGWFGTLTLAAALLAGCAQPAQDGGTVPSSPSGQPSDSSSVPPTLGSPSAPPQTPSDQRRTDWIAGRITRGGDGPCFGLVTDEGKEYALYSTAKVTLKAGESVRVQVAPLRLKISCGSGTQMSAVKIVPAG
jgi:hypothetical protein